MAVSTNRIHRHRLPTGVLSAAVSTDGVTAYLGTMDGVHRIDVASGESKKLYQHGSYVSSVALVPGQPLLVSAGYDGNLKWYDTQEGLVVRHLTAHDFWSWAMAVSPDGQHIATVSGQYLAGGYRYEPAAEREPSVRVYRVHDGTLVHSLSHVPSVQSVAFSPDSRFLAAGNLVGEVRIWEMHTGEISSTFKTDDFTSWGIIKSHHYLGGIFDLHFTPDGDQLLLTGMGPMRDPMAGNGKQMWQRFAWKSDPPEKLDEYKGGEGLMETLAFHPKGYFVMAGRLRGGDWNAAVFSKSGENIHSLKTGCRITKALFTDDGAKLVLAGAQSQGAPKDGQFKPFGRFDVFEFSTSS